jgi:DNA-binding PadR family transcriptional regulator
MGPGTLYGTLKRLVDDGLIEETTDRAGRPGRADSERRRYYELTANGRASALAELARLRTLVHRVGGQLAGGAPA